MSKRASLVVDVVRRFSKLLSFGKEPVLKNGHLKQVILSPHRFGAVVLNELEELVPGLGVRWIRGNEKFTLLLSRQIKPTRNVNEVLRKVRLADGLGLIDRYSAVGDAFHRHRH